MKVTNALRNIFLNNIYGGNLYLENLAIFVLNLKRERENHSHKYRYEGISKIEVSIEDKIPKLAWLLQVDTEKALAYIGSNVESREEGFVEGMWAGEFQKFNFDKSGYLFGSGVRIRNGEIVICPPKQTEEKLYMVRNKEEDITYVSNSIAFLLKMSNFYKEKEYEHFLAILTESGNIATKYGIDRYANLFFKTDKFEWYRFMFYNFKLDLHGIFKVLPFYSSKSFYDFKSYRQFLNTKTGELFKNAASYKRKTKYQPLTMISSGYDSPTVSIIAKENGCVNSATIEVEVYGNYESGYKIAQKIGYKKIVKKSHPLGKKIGNLNSFFNKKIESLACEFIATDGVGDDLVFKAFDDIVSETVLVSGAYGDSVWDYNSDLPKGLPVRIPYGKSITEYRLNKGFIFFPMAFLGARFPRVIRKISRSREMEEYNFGGNYNRPIPRRIIEEAGVNRGEFAKTKVATSPLLLNYNALKKQAFKEVMKRYKL